MNHLITNLYKKKKAQLSNHHQLYIRFMAIISTGWCCQIIIHHNVTERYDKSYLHEWTFFPQDFEDGHCRYEKDRGKGQYPSNGIGPEGEFIITISCRCEVKPGESQDKLRRGKKKKNIISNKHFHERHELYAVCDIHFNIFLIS